ncbi:tRNA (N6-threonylcarbamoyladenosine(37)-N6)-methyltransferase TrmO [bacterium]|nr:tRNA (N6-threonylcarbamoyladenosine(37)-N6)-methyltransferase TrmO [bacterium]
MVNSGFQIVPIGHVNVSREGFLIKIEKPYLDGLRGVEEFGHLIVLWWSHLCDNDLYRKELIGKQPYKNSPSEVGIFATRSPARPNPVSLTTVAVSSVDKVKGIVRIPYIDAEEGSPVIDIKPYHPSLDRIRDIGMPTWCNHWPKWHEDSATFDWEAEFINAQ